jgi:predicted phage-related endonuclease
VSVSTTKTTTAVVTESKTIELPAEAEKLIVKLNDLRSAIKHLEELEKSVKADILVELNGAEEGLINGVVRITAKEQTRSGVDAKKLKEVFPEAASMCATSSTYLVIKTK